MFENDLEITKIFGNKIADFGNSSVNDTAVAKNDLEITPIFFVWLL
jgi:hypothetical protein